MRSALLEPSLFANALEEFAGSRVERFGLGSSPEQERAFEREYLLSEVCMSVFCTEILGYWQEIWERPPSPELPDPLKLLYEKHPEIIPKTVGHSPRRQLRFLYPNRQAAAALSD